MEISVIIPIYNADKTILQTLSGLQSQTVNDFEVIVVDDGSTDASRELVSEFSNRTPLPIKLIHQKNSGPATARNVGVEHSSGGIILFLDSDCIPPPNWIEAMTRPISGSVIGCNCGYKVKNEDSIIARYIGYEIARRHERIVGKRIDAFGSYAASFRKDVFLEVGGFSTEYTAANAEDFDLGFHIRRMGYSLIFTGETFVYHYHPDSLKVYLRQQYTRGYWRVKMYLRNRDTIVKGDSYTGHEAQVQAILSSLTFISLPLMLVNPYSLAICLGLLLLSNLPLGLWVFRKEKKFLLVAPILASLRSLAGTVGAYSYVINNAPSFFKELLQTRRK